MRKAVLALWLTGATFMSGTGFAATKVHRHTVVKHPKRKTAKRVGVGAAGGAVVGGLIGGGKGAAVGAAAGAGTGYVYDRHKKKHGQ